jgi:hypothetical protein
MIVVVVVVVVVVVDFYCMVYVVKFHLLVVWIILTPPYNYP